MSRTRFQDLLAALSRERVEFILVGGWAAVVHGSAHITQDVDVCYSRSPENLERLCRAVLPLKPALRGAPRDLPFRLDPPTLKAGLNFTLETELGALDLLGELSPLGGYDQVLPHSSAVPLFGLSVRVLSLSALIRAKRAAGRPKDLLMVPELEALEAMQQSPPVAPPPPRRA